MDSNQSAKIAHEVVELLDFASPEEWKKLLWDWFKSTVSGSYDQLSKKEKKNMGEVYEKMDDFIQKVGDHIVKSKNNSTNL